MFINKVPIPGEFCVKNKEAEKISKYQNLKYEISRMWNTKTRVIAKVIAVLGAESLLTEYLVLIEVMTRKGDSMQQTAMLGSAHILRKVLFISS